MMWFWLAASIPFWLISSILFVVGAIGVSAFAVLPLAGKATLIKNPAELFFGSLVWLGFSGFFALIAAKVVS